MTHSEATAIARRRQIVSRFAAPIAFAVLAILVIVSALCALSPWLFSGHPVGESRLVARHDNDVAILLTSLSQKPTWISTFSWWRTSWCPTSFVHFWRPLTVQAFWLEKHFFTVDRFDRWMWVTFILHVACVVLYGRFVFLLSGRRDITFLSVALYAVWRIGGIFSVDLETNAPAFVTLDAWKNQPDLFADCFVFGALVCALRERYWSGVLCAFLAVAFKESGWMAFILPPIIFTIMGRLKRVPRSVYLGASAAAVVLIVLRAAAGPDVFRGYHMGSNTHWFSRYYLAVAGVYFVTASTRIVPWLVGNAVFAAAWLRARGRIASSWTVFSALFLFSLALDDWTMQMPLTSSIALYFDPRMLSLRIPAIMSTYLWLCGVTLMWRDKSLRRLGVIAALCGAVAALPYAAASQVLVHTLHQALAFQSLFVAVMLATFWECWIKLPVVQRLIPYVSPQVSPVSPFL